MQLKSRVTVNRAEHAVAERFASAAYWQPEFEDLFSGELVMDLPFAPPGMWQHFNAAECGYHFEWLRNTVSRWQLYSPAKILATDHPHIYWVIREAGCKTHWAQVDGIFKSKMPALLRIEDGKITYLKEHFDMAAFYDAIGVELPRFMYDAQDPKALEPRPPASYVEHTEKSLEKQLQATLNFFINPNYWDPDINGVLADDFIHELCNAPKDMPRVYTGTEYDSINAWLGEKLGWCDIYNMEFYYTSDPHVYIAEFNCMADTCWGGTKGHYANREISYIEVNDQGLCTRLDEYFITQNKFNSAGISIPSFPYMFY